VLELSSGSIKYVYSGFDNTNPEILDQGRVDFSADDWTGLFISLSEYLKDIVSRKLPPFRQLETYIIPPPEMITESQAGYLDMNGENKDEWLKWELSQTLLYEHRGYSIECSLPSRRFADKPDQITGLAMRNRHLRRISSLFQENSLFLNGVYMPHTLWLEIANSTAPTKSNLHLLFKDNGSYSHIYFRKHNYPRIQYYGDVAVRENSESHSFEKMIENLSFDMYANNCQLGTKVFVFRDNFDHNEVLLLEDQIKTEVNIIADNPILPVITKSNVEYLLLLVAQKKTGELFVCRQT
jgi:hypothetical protein